MILTSLLFRLFRESEASSVVWKEDFGLDECGTVNVVESAHYLVGLFEHGFLVFSDGYGSGFEECDVCCL